MYLYRCVCCGYKFLIPAERAGIVYHCPETGQRIDLPNPLPDNFSEYRWLTCTDPYILQSYVNNKANDRKRRLLQCSFSRSICDKTTRILLEPVLSTAEAFADGNATLAELESAWQQLEKDSKEQASGSDSWMNTAFIAGRASQSSAWCYSEAKTANLKMLHCEFVRDVMGNPFHEQPTVQPVWLTSNNGAVRRVAQTMYDDRNFEGMPILADALEDAGCEDREILEHCRGNDSHIRGCWVLDLLLDKK